MDHNAYEKIINHVSTNMVESEEANLKDWHKPEDRNKEFNNSDFLEYDAMLIHKKLLMFKRSLLPPSLGSQFNTAQVV
jgi:CRISPR/Cas system CMR-associated protein Cmr5 small subunit